MMKLHHLFEQNSNKAQNQHTALTGRQGKESDGRNPHKTSTQLQRHERAHQERPLFSFLLDKVNNPKQFIAEPYLHF